MFCSYCGMKNDPENKFCSQCGKDLRPMAPPTLARRRSVWPFVLLGVLVLLALVVVAFLLKRGESFSEQVYAATQPAMSGATVSPSDGASPAPGLTDNLQPITVANAGQIAELERWGNGIVTSVLYAPDGKTVALIFSTHTEIRDSRRFEVLRSLDKTGPAVFSPNGKTLAVATMDGGIYFWDLQSGDEKKIADISFPPAFGLQFSPDGSLFAYTEIVPSNNWNISTKVLKIPSLQLIFQVSRQNNSLPTRFSADGKTIYTGGDNLTIRQYNLISGQIIHEEAFKDDAWSMDLSPDNRVIAVGDSNGGVKGLQTDTWQVAFSYQHNAAIQTMAFSADSRYLASGSEDKSIRIWDLKEQKEAVVLKGHAFWIISLVFSPDGQHLISSSFDGKTLMWNTVSWKVEKVVYQSLFAHPTPIYAQAHQTFVIGNWGNPALLIDGAHQTVLKTIPVIDEEDYEGTYQVTANGEAIVYCRDTIKIISLHIDREDEVKPAGHPCKRLAVVSNAGDQIVYEDFNEHWIVYNLSAKEEQYTIDDVRYISQGEFSGDLQILVLVNSEGIKVFDNRTGSQTANIPIQTSVAVLSMDGKYLATSDYTKASIMLLDAASGRVIRTFHGNETNSLAQGVSEIAFSSDDRLIAAVSARHILIFDTMTGELLKDIQRLNTNMTSLSFAPDNRWLMSGSNESTIHFWGIR